mmetsp:Transcript_15335/g.21067  ORF Transcript_15335/g.21067 Transcript_15335/m.21067 type:complete len:89 (+) Transcript_15335:1080-1346(+)|eukprot:CAMPEP_0170059950 /NCGR_PEP_ID=MMETSP0019_2-20121128/2046_1 /TAXON_ID=98059 /ORGANISM="Dinobryon sp., Strain UTEXLB2267" /LENGTH=88 /DNA_ID=CAMNT_0010265349 /DNA_START=1032 /DNA_END=1298 /DNA_ORIENTATION=+
MPTVVISTNIIVGGKKKADDNNDDNDEGADCNDSLSKGLAKFANENNDGGKYGNRKAPNEVTLTVRNVEQFARENRTASHRKMLELYS